MHLKIRMLFFASQIMIVFLMTILISHYDVSEISGTRFNSQQSVNEMAVHSPLMPKAAAGNSVIYNTADSITEMEGANDSTSSAQEEHTSDPRDTAIITMQRHGTPDGASPVYSLTVHGNGSVTYRGIRNVDTTGIQTYQIPKDKARELVNEFINIYYFALQDEYNNSSNASSSDTVTTSINMNGKTKSIVDNKNSYGPESLRALEDKIDQVTNSKRLIHHQ
jgi:hypothetical protein